MMAKVASEMSEVCKARGKGAAREQVQSYAGVCAPGGKAVPARRCTHCCSCAVGLSSSVSE